MTSIPMPAEPTTSGALPSAQDLAAMGMTAQQFADLQNSIAGISGSPILSGPLDLIGGSSPYSRTINEADYLIGAPKSNKGNPTSTLRQSGNDFFVYDNQKIRLVDNKTGRVIFEGAGPADAKKASDMAAQLTSEGGRKANWDIQVGPQTLDTSMMGVPTRAEGSWMTVANENPNKGVLGTIGDIVGTALPIAVSLIPGLQVLGPIASSVAAGGAGAALRGDNVLKGAVMGGLSSAGGELLGPVIEGAGVGAKAATAIGTGLGATAGGLATGQSLKNSLLGGVASGGLSYLGGEAFGKRGTTPSGDVSGNIGSSGVELGDIVVNAGIPRFSGAVFTPSFGDKAQMNSDQADPYGTRDFAVRTPAATGSGLTQDEILVNALRNTGSSTFSVGAPKTKVDFSVPEEIIVQAQKDADMGSSTLAVGGPYLDAAGNPIDETVVTARKEPTSILPAVVGVGTAGGGIALADLLANANAANAAGATTSASDLAGSRVTPTAAETAALNAGAGAGGVFGTGLTAGQAALIGSTALDAISNIAGGSGSNRVSPGGQQLQSIFSAKLPTPGEGGAFKVGGLDYTTPPARSAADMYRYAMGPAMDIPAGVNLARATSPYAGFGPGTLGQETFNRITAGAGPEVYGRQPGFTGVATNQTVGDTQVVDGNTWVWGGPQRGWEMQYIDPVTGQKKTIPGNGATNVSSFANNPTIPVNQPYFKQNLTNIPDWADTYHGWQKAMMNANVPQDVRFAAEREFMQALEQRPFSNANDLVAFARSLYNRSTQPRAAAHGGSMGYSRGSSRESFAVNGPGTGRSDEIPAVLSDGEYVIDAETVALLGDGSSKAGAKKLDEMRIKIRKHKGRNLAKGKFSVNAKRPEKYLSGGRA